MSCPTTTGVRFLLVILVVLLLELAFAHPPPHPHPHHRHHHHGVKIIRHKHNKLLNFYGDGRSGKELLYPAAYVELKYPVLRHPRHNTLPHPPPHFHHHPHPPVLEFRSGPPHSPFPDGSSDHSSGGPGPGGAVPSSIVTYTRTTTIEKGPDGVITTEGEWEPPIYEAGGGHGELGYEDAISGGGSVDPTYDEVEMGLGNVVGGSSYGGNSGPPYDFVSEVNGDQVVLLDSGGPPPPPVVSAPLIENLGAIVKDEVILSNNVHKDPPPPPPPVRVGQDEKVIKNVALNEYIWVRREEGTPNIALTLDPVRKSTYFLDDVVVSRRIHVVSRERVCIQGTPWTGRKASASDCSALDDPLIHWDFVAIKHGQYWIQGSGSNHCLQPGLEATLPRFVEMQPCDLYEPSQLWELGTVPLNSGGVNNFSKGWKND